MSMLFAFLTQTLMTSQVATGLSLTLLGLGLSGLIGEGFTGLPGVKLASIHIPVLTDIPFVGPILFGQDILVYASLALIAATGYVLFRTPDRPRHQRRGQQPPFCSCARLRRDQGALCLHRLRRRLLGAWPARIWRSPTPRSGSRA